LEGIGLWDSWPCIGLLQGKESERKKNFSQFWGNRRVSNT
jgi:hypothetical protein